MRDLWGEGGNRTSTPKKQQYLPNETERRRTSRETGKEKITVGATMFIDRNRLRKFGRIGHEQGRLKLSVKVDIMKGRVAQC